MSNFKQQLHTEDEALANMLDNVDVEPASTDFTQRIMHAAARIEQKPALTIKALISEIVGDFFEPKAAVSFASVLAFGLFIGVNNPFANELNTDTTTTNNTFELSSYFYDEGGFL